MIAVVIVDFLSEALTRRAVAGLVNLDRSDLRFIIVDNGSSVDAAAMMADFPDLTVLQPGANAGFAAGCNLGIKRAIDDGAEYCLLLNPDTRTESDFIEPLIDAMQHDATLGIASPTILEDDGSDRITDGGGTVNWWAGSPKGIVGRRLSGPGPYVAVPFATGAAMLIRCQAAVEAGPMDEGYFLYFEDADYCQLILRKGWKIGYLPQAELRHATSSVAGRKSAAYLYYFARNRIRFMRRWGRWHQRLVFAVFNGLVRLPAMLVLYGLIRRRPGAAAAIARGFIDGLLGRNGPAPVQAG